MVFLTVLKKRQRKESQARVLVLGLDNAGKSSVIAKALNAPQSEVHPTFGFQIESLQYNDLNLNIWDVGGQQSLRPYWHNYFEKTDFLVWVIDATALQRLQTCRKELHDVLGSQDRLTGAGLLILINKIDAVPQDERESRVREVEKQLSISQFKEHHNCKVIACSAYTGEGVFEGLDYLTNEIKQRLYSL